MTHNFIKSNDEEVDVLALVVEVQAIYLNTDILKMESVSNAVEQKQWYTINTECLNK